MGVTAILGATVIDGTARPPTDNAVILVDGNRIRSISATNNAIVPAGAKVIDAHGKYIVPGLMDANAHLFGAPLPDLVLQYEGRYSDILEEASQIALKSGVTTIFDTWGPLDPLVTVRDRINRGEILGSRLFVGGNIIGFAGPLSPDFFATMNIFGADTVKRINRQWEHDVGSDLMWLTPDGVRSRVRQYIEKSSIDFVKYAASGHRDPFITFSAPAQRAIVEEAHRAGLTVQAHTTSPESLRMEIEAGADLLQHGDITGMAPMPETTLKTIVERSLPVAALLSTEKHQAWMRDHGTEAMRTLFNDNLDNNDRRLIAAGARLLLTTDGFVCGPPVVNHPRVAPHVKGAVDYPKRLGESHFLWLEAAVERGMTPMDALRSATSNIAEAYGQSADLGTLEAGKYADLLILDADPLHDVRNWRRIVAVMKDGILIDRSRLPIRRILTEEDPGAAKE
jgi:imidazolonepropionase-like amidohydrolase